MTAKQIPIQHRLRLDRSLGPTFDELAQLPESIRGREISLTLRFGWVAHTASAAAIGRPTPAVRDCSDSFEYRLRVYPYMGGLYDHLASIPSKLRGLEIQYLLRLGSDWRQGRIEPRFPESVMKACAELRDAHNNSVVEQTPSEPDDRPDKVLSILDRSGGLDALDLAMS